MIGLYWIEAVVEHGQQFELLKDLYDQGFFPWFFEVHYNRAPEIKISIGYSMLE